MVEAGLYYLEYERDEIVEFSNFNIRVNHKIIFSSINTLTIPQVFIIKNLIEISVSVELCI